MSEAPFSANHGPDLTIRIAEAVHLAFTRRPDALSVRKRLMHPYEVYGDHDAMNYARDVIIGVLNTLLQELPPARIRSLEQGLSDELSEAVECYTHSGNHPAPPHPQPGADARTHSDQAAPPDDRPDTSPCIQSQDPPQESFFMSDTDDPRARLGKMLSAALYVAAFGHAGLVGAKTRQDLVGDEPDLTHLEMNVLAKKLIVDCQLAIIEVSDTDALGKLLGAAAFNPLHFAKERGSRLIDLHAAQLEAVPVQEIGRILKDQDSRRQEIHARRSRSSESRSPTGSLGRS